MLIVEIQHFQEDASQINLKRCRTVQNIQPYMRRKCVQPTMYLSVSTYLYSYYNAISKRTSISIKLSIHSVLRYT